MRYHKSNLRCHASGRGCGDAFHSSLDFMRVFVAVVSFYLLLRVFVEKVTFFLQTCPPGEFREAAPCVHPGKLLTSFTLEMCAACIKAGRNVWAPCTCFGIQSRSGNLF
ncbi:hypothetical protein CEXT_757181 [Caerostris extrusa]|uniref:Uncharacterized protein n=1 Tax=Caerostris extrusa TaxID=172846 RepID=A0AAV4V9F4_CAEEX|nr:hypothetical protein CEXT_757181 [Caerostris extrusa]